MRNYKEHVLILSAGRPISIMTAEDAARYMTEQGEGSEMRVFRSDGKEFVEWENHGRYYIPTDEIVKIFRLPGGRLFRVPAVIGLTYKVGNRKDIRSAGWSKSNVMVRDNYTCAYCGVSAGDMRPDGTFFGRGDFDVEHILPKSRGGGDTWMNTVCSCRNCNQKKADRTPREANMELLFRPHKPRGPFVLNLDKCPESWRPYFE